ncbi:hypothetical protein [Glutamicibacter nicotianae]|uniref:hypothetical protein n=1 Tax=Glutamicibacter nicotianae TaxID=37929 RepID=UPI002555364D|nr:hypothetical protein [Glutamicibacter nicotianae]WIV43049.1 hypothetical protein QQS42_12095 [Glutamicibacter nicotianae]
MTTAPAQTNSTATKKPQDLKLCEFFNQEHRECFDAGLDALTLCREWVSPTEDFAVNRGYENPNGKTVRCPKCQAVKDLRNGN